MYDLMLHLPAGSATSLNRASTSQDDGVVFQPARPSVSCMLCQIVLTYSLYVCMNTCNHCTSSSGSESTFFPSFLQHFKCLDSVLWARGHKHQLQSNLWSASMFSAWCSDSSSGTKHGALLFVVSTYLIQSSVFLQTWWKSPTHLTYVRAAL